LQNGDPDLRISGASADRPLRRKLSPDLQKAGAGLRSIARSYNVSAAAIQRLDG
jgi:hypothetical protein